MPAKQLCKPLSIRVVQSKPQRNQTVGGHLIRKFCESVIFNTWTLVIRIGIKRRGLKTLIPKRNCNRLLYSHPSSIQFHICMWHYYFFQIGTFRASSWYPILFFYFPVLNLMKHLPFLGFLDETSGTPSPLATALSTNVMRIPLLPSCGCWGRE